MPAFPATWNKSADIMASKDVVSFAEATAVREIDTHTYEVQLQDEWCIGAGKPYIHWPSAELERVPEV